VLAVTEALAVLEGTGPDVEDPECELELELELEPDEAEA
jgi:hypothetical protein